MTFWHKLVGFGRVTDTSRWNRVSNRSRRRRSDNFSFAALEPRQLMAIDLVADVIQQVAGSNPEEIVEVPGKGMAVTAISKGGSLDLFTIDLQGNRTLHQINALSIKPSQLTHYKDVAGQDWIYFSGTDGTDGLELYRLKFGTTDVKRVKDINPIASSEPKEFTVFGNNIYFTAWNYSTGRELWRTNGTAAGTVLVKDILPGVNLGSNPQELTRFGNALYFAANDGVWGRELWRTNGTEAGTFMVKNIGIQSGSSNPRELTVAGNKIFFSAYSFGGGREVWQSDGTPAGTSILKDIVPLQGSSSPEELTAWNDNLFFTAVTPEKGRELYRFEPTVFNSTFLVKDINPGVGSSDPTDLTVSGNKLFFVATSPEKGRELWRTYGTAPGTEVVRDIVVGASSSNPKNLVDVSGRIYFSAHTSTGGFELYKSDGETITTLLVKNINANNSSDPQNLTSVNGKVVFSADDGVHGRELWSSAGTSATTVLDDIAPGNYGSNPYGLSNIGNNVFFFADSPNGRRLFVVASGTNTMATELASGDQDFTIGYANTQAVGDTVYFLKRSMSGVDRVQLWKTTGTMASTMLLTEMTGPFASGTPQMFASGNLLYLIMYENSGNHQLWKSDGTVNGSARLKSGIQFQSIGQVTNANGRLFFVGVVDGVPRLWRSDGTNSSTNMFNTLSHPDSLVANGDQVYFFAIDGSVKNFYRVNGLNAPVVIKANVYGLGSGIKINGIMYFGAQDNLTNGLQLLKSTGNPSETSLIPITNSAGPSSIGDFHNVGGKLVFTANTNSFGRELWVSDGTDAGTKQLKNIGVGVQGGQITPLAVFENELYFSAFDGLMWAIWKSDGTTVGTKKVTELNDRFRSITEEATPYYHQILAVDDRLYFAASDAMFGMELFAFRN